MSNEEVVNVRLTNIETSLTRMESSLEKITEILVVQSSQQKDIDRHDQSIKRVHDRITDIKNDYAKNLEKLEIRLQEQERITWKVAGAVGFIGLLAGFVMQFYAKI